MGIRGRVPAKARRATLEMSRAPAATEISFRSFRRPSGLSVLRATEDLTTPCASALVAPAEQRGAGCGNGHEDNGRHGAHFQPFSEDDQAGEGGYGGVETHQDAEYAGGDLAQRFELQRVRDGRGEHRHAEAGEEELRIEQGVACACYPERKEDERPYAERDHQPRPTRESAPRAGGEEDVGGPQASGQEREGHTHRIEVHPTEHAERSEQEDTGRGEHDPQQVEQSPGAGDGHTERTHELERNGNAQGYAVEGQVERNVHPRKREPEESSNKVPGPVVPTQLRAHQEEKHERREGDPQEDRTAGTKRVEKALGHGSPELDGDYGEDHESRRWRTPQTAREARGERATVRQRDENLSCRTRGADSLTPA